MMGMTELLCHQNTENPILSTMLDLLKLMDIHSVSWIPLTGDGAWAVEKMDLAFIAALSLVGSLFLKVLYPYMVWPWPLAKLLDEPWGDSAEQVASAILCPDG